MASRLTSSGLDISFQRGRETAKPTKAIRTHHKAQGNSGLHRFVHALVILCTITAGRHGIFQRKADK